MSNHPVYLILDVEYNPDPCYGRELGWLAPPLKDEPELILTEDDEKDFGDGSIIDHRKWAGIVSADGWAKLTREWSIDPDGGEPNGGMITEYGHLAARAYGWDGMGWNLGGNSPIAYVSLYVSIPV